MLKAAGQHAPPSKPILEINPKHPVVRASRTRSAHFDDWANVLFDQAMLAEGGQLDDPGDVRQAHQPVDAGDERGERSSQRRHRRGEGRRGAGAVIARVRRVNASDENPLAPVAAGRGRDAAGAGVRQCWCRSCWCRQDNATVQRGALDRARAMMTGVDAVLADRSTTVKALAASSALAADDLRHSTRKRCACSRTQPTWTTVTLMLPSGEKVIDVSRPSGRRCRPCATCERRRRGATMRAGDRTVSSVPAGRAPGVPVRVPVIRDGKVAYVLTAVVRPDSFEELITRQRLPDGWISGIVDRDGRFVARVPARPAGDLASVPFRAALLQAREGWYRGLTVDGKDAYTAHVLSDYSGWAIGLAIPSDIVLAAMHKTSWLIGIGVLGSIVLAMLVVWLSGRRIVLPIVSLATAARSVGTGATRPEFVDGGVEEVTAVAVALERRRRCRARTAVADPAREGRAADGRSRQGRVHRGVEPRASQSARRADRRIVRAAHRRDPPIRPRAMRATSSNGRRGTCRG